MTRLKLRRLAVMGFLFIACGTVRADAPSEAPHDSGGFQFRIGGFFPSGSGAFWEASEQIYTLDAGDFNDVILGFTYLAPISNHIELGFNVDFFDARVASADREFTDQYYNPVVHDTRLGLIPLSIDLRVLPGGRYEARGHRGRGMARKIAPYVGAGMGMTYWEYEEEGDFVLGPYEPIVYQRFMDTGTAFSVHVLAGIEIPAGPAWSILIEGRYDWADAEVGGSFGDLDEGELDLGGMSLNFGMAVRF